MVLTKEQIAEIRRFIASRGVTYYDIQNEIIDHIASAIEEKMEADPKLKLDEAIREAHRSFGPLGFSDMEDTFKKSAYKKLARRRWRSFLGYFTSDKYAVGFLPMIVFYFALQFPSYFSWVAYGTLGSITLFSLALGFKFRRKRYHKKYATAASAFGLLFAIANLPLQLVNLLRGKHNFSGAQAMLYNPWWHIGLSLLFGTLVLLIFAERDNLRLLEEEIEEIERLEHC